jgi:transposase
MAKSNSSKTDTLRNQGVLNPHPEKVKDSLFDEFDFFDARDLVQVKYEMVRRVQVDGEPVSHSAAAFGFSRPSFYQAQAALEEGGLAALVPKKRGPRRSHKLSTEVMDFLLQELAEDASLRSGELVDRVGARFGIKVHPRSIERALAREKKKPPPTHR